LRDVGEMVDWISRQHGGQRVIVMGNCQSGSLPLAVLGRRDVRAGVLCQPALPNPTLPEVLAGSQPADARRALAIPKAMLDASVHALKTDPTKRLLGFHYFADPLGAFEKFEVIHQLFGDHFRPIVLINPAENPEQWKHPESWWRVRQTKGIRSKTSPHNTVTCGATLEDRQRLRAILYGELETLR
jgi:hypothetical protein